MGVNESLGLTVIFDGITAGFDAALGKVKSGLQEAATLGGKISNVGDGLMRFGAGLTALTAPVGLAMGAGLKVAADFESVMAEVAARTGVAGAELTKISDFAKKMGADTAFSASQAAQGLLELIAAGMSTQEAMATLPAVLDAAAASGLDLGTTARQISQIMSTFNVKTKDAGGVVDVLARAAGASAAEIPDLADGIANVGGVAAKFGLTVEDTAAILALFAKQGLRGAEAGTQLRSMLLNISRPTNEVEAAWKKLGVSLYTATGNVRPFNTVMEELKVKLAGLPIQQQNELLTALGGSYGIVGLTALTSGMSIDQMKNSMSQQAGASEVAGAKMGTFNMAVESLKGSVETLMITALTPLMNNVLKPMVNDLIPVVNQVTEWTKANPELTATIVKIAGAALLAGPAIGLLGGAIKGMGAAITFALGPAGLTLLAIGGLLLWVNDRFGSLENAVDAAKTATAQLGFLMLKALNDASGAAGELIGNITGGLTTAIQDMGVTVRRLAGSLGMAFTDVGNALGQLFWNLGNSVGSFITDRIVTAMQAYALLAAITGDTQTAISIAQQIDSLTRNGGAFVPTPYADWMTGYANEQYQARAMGGPVKGGSPYLVGERGPELFVPGRSGNIVPNGALMGGGVMHATIILRGEGFEDHIYQRVAVALG